MNAKWAPPPWEWVTSGKPGGNGDLNFYIQDAAGRKIAAVWGKRGEREATAALMDSAPELYEALIAASDMLFSRPDITEKLRVLMGPAELAVCDQCAVALKKARGE